MTTESAPNARRAACGRRVLVIHNPAAGGWRQRRLADVLERLAAMECEVTVRETRRRGDAEEFARAAWPTEFDVVAAAGGDGTVNEVVNGLAAGPGGVKLAVIPLGTANVLAHEIGLDPKDMDAIAATIASGDWRNVHLGVANGRHFMMMAGAGLDARVVEGMNGTFKRYAGKFAYVAEGVRQAFGYDFPEISVRANGRTYQGRMAVACKGRFYGGPFVAAPKAKLDDPKLHICILPRTGAAGAMRYGLALPMGWLADLPEVEMISADSITILGPRGAPVQADGDIVARLPAEIAVSRETVDLLVP